MPGHPSLKQWRPVITSEANVRGDGTNITNPSLVIQNGNPTASVRCFPGMWAKKHERSTFSKQGFSTHISKLHRIIGGHLWQKLGCQIPRQNKTEWPRPDLYCPRRSTSVTKEN